MLNAFKNRLVRKYKRKLGILPDYLIIGAMKCGTTSLYEYLTQHPNIRSASKKEIHFFDWSYDKGLPAYRSYFPTSTYRWCMKHLRKYEFICGEASPYYLFHPHVSRRVRQTLPNIKLLVILRNPADRAYSHYWHWIREKIEHLSFEDALKAEPERLKGEYEAMLADETYDSYNYGFYSYLARGRYIEQIKRWESHFPKEQMLILSSEKMYASPPEVLDRVAEFLNIPKWHLKTHRSHNAGKYPQMAPKTRQQLADYFAPYNQQLYDHIGYNFGWDGE